jgi:hypothetical protein
MTEILGNKHQEFGAAGITKSSSIENLIPKNFLHFTSMADDYKKERKKESRKDGREEGREEILSVNQS